MDYVETDWRMELPIILIIINVSRELPSMTCQSAVRVYDDAAACLL